jgi:hypothetical protein
MRMMPLLPRRRRSLGCAVAVTFALIPACSHARTARDGDYGECTRFAMECRGNAVMSCTVKVIHNPFDDAEWTW